MFIKPVQKSHQTNRFIVLMILMCFSTMLNAATRYVTTNSTSAAGGLAYEIAQAPAGDIIEVQNDITIGADISISKTITINGNGYTISVQITGVDDNGNQNTSPSTYRIFTFSGSSITITLNDLILKGGDCDGACIYNVADKLVLNRVVISNSRLSGSGGGGLYNDNYWPTFGTVYMNDCQLLRNSALAGAGFLNLGIMYIEKTTISENCSDDASMGGGGGENQGTLYINNCTFSNNKSTGIGGGIHNYNGNLHIINSTFTGNVIYGDSLSASGGAIGNNGGTVDIINCIFAYNYKRINGSPTAGSVTNPTAFELDDFGYQSSNVYYSIYHSTTNIFNTNTGNIAYTGTANGSDNSIFVGGVLSKITDGTGTQIGTAQVFQPFLVPNVQAKTASLKIGSFPNQTSPTNRKGVRTGYTDGGGTPSVGYLDPTNSTWVNIVGTAASSNQITVDQKNTTRSNPPTRGSVESEINTVYMLKVLKGTNGSSNGGSLYGDIYESGDQVTLTAIPIAGYKFDHWKNATTSANVSTSNPYILSISSDLTLEPVFVTSTTFAVTYIGNNQTAGAAPSGQTFSSGGSATIASKGNLYRDEYYFNGWNTNTTGTGTNYAAGATYNTGSNLTLYAVWVPYIKYYVKSASTSAINNLASWSATPDGSGGSPLNFNNDKIFILSNSASSTTFSTGASWTVAGAIKIPTGSTLTITANTTTTLSNDITNAGILIGAAGSTLTLNGTSMQYLAGDQILANFISNNTIGVTLQDSTDITESLDLLTGTLFTGGHLNLKSTATKTAIVKALGSGAAISGLVTVERYIPAKRAFRYISPGVTTTTSIYANWQENGRSASGRGTHITGNGSNGFDATHTGNSSLFTYNQSTGAWSAVANTNSTVLTAGTPYSLLIRGDRTVNLASYTPTPNVTTLRTRGTLHTGSKTVSFNNAGSGNDLFIGNPYQAPVDLSGIISVAGTNINSNIWIWDPTLATRGAYVSVNVSSNTNTNGSSTANKFLQPAQAFFAVSSGANSSLTFTESSKGNTFSNTWRTTTPDAEFRIRLFYSDSFNTNAHSCDGITAEFSNDFNDGIDNNDVIKYGNLDETLSWVNDAKTFVKEERILPREETEMALRINQYRQKNYTLVFDYTGDVQKDAWIYDGFLNSYHTIKLGSNVYHFSINDTLSNDPNRFKVVFFNPSLSASRLAHQNRWSISPNPVSGSRLFIAGPETEGNVTAILYDLQGRTIASIIAEQDSSKGWHLELPSSLAAACYQLRVSSARFTETHTIYVTP